MDEKPTIRRNIKLGIVWCMNAFAQWVTKVLCPDIYKESKRRNVRNRQD